MTRSLVGSGALHALVLAILLALTSPAKQSTPGTTRGGGRGLSVLPVRLEVSAAAGASVDGASSDARTASPKAQPQSAELYTELTEAQPKAADAALATPAAAEVAATPAPTAPSPVAASDAASDAALVSDPSDTPGGEGEGSDAGGEPVIEGSGGGEGGGSGPASGPGAGHPAAGELDAPPVPLHVAVPALPREVTASAHGARVRLLIAVSESGEVEGVNVIQGSGFPALDGSAVEAARKLRYLPATRSGLPVAAVTEAEIVF